MKKTKKLLALGVSMLMLGGVLAGCSSEKSTPEESAKAQYNFIMKGQKEEFKKLGASDKEVDDILNKQKDEYSKKLKSNFKVAGLTVTDGQVNSILDARQEAINKVTVKTETVKKEKTEATVKVSTTYIEERKLDEKAGQDALKVVQDAKITDEKAAKEKFKEEYVKNLIAAYKSATPSKGEKSKEFKFVLKDKVWIAESSFDFGFGISKLSIGEI
ncbi:protein of unknown function [Clostridium cavendishii DSM 21758]|uniref:DUF5105 domain-containing protein n=1 Tax=Clostridium cavendishii DSM 21758 TaxID=1121302 RepID=A0A1M6GAQ1_9CLOT|nr:hypothetical protein [Clostridium cavendishii]SHJ07043.1 protein of unknown function [Clostridium cavendishii DSM 21758]